MNTIIELEPSGIYTASQAIRATGIPRNTFYRWVRLGRIPRHCRVVDKKWVYKGNELLRALTQTVSAPVLPEIVRRGRPKVSKRTRQGDSGMEASGKRAG